LPDLTFANGSDERLSKTYYLHVTPIRRVGTGVLRSAFKTISQLIVNGVEDFPESGPVIIACNHLTNFDVFPLQFSIPRPIFFMGKEELFRNATTDWFFRQLGAFPVYRGERDYWAFQHSIKILQSGQVLGMFPEGTRNKGQGLRSAKTGAARLSIATGSSIIPVALNGTQHLFNRFPHRTALTVTIGLPILASDDHTPIGLTDQVMFALADLLPPEMRGVYGYHPPGF
jgi:1-acyl-sn-glycerol-3-phosphate acyltransferase